MIGDTNVPRGAPPTVEDAGCLRVVRSAFQLIEATMAPCTLALFALHAQQPWLVLSNRLDQGVLDLLAGLSAASLQRLAAGIPEAAGVGGDFVLVPCHGTAGLVGVLYLSPAGRALGWLGRHVRPLAALLADAMHALGGAGLAGARGAPEVEPAARYVDPRRVALELALEKHEWNVTRTGRALGVSRTTVYNQIRRHGIPRKHVRLTPRRGTAAEQVAC